MSRAARAWLLPALLLGMAGCSSPRSASSCAAKDAACIQALQLAHPVRTLKFWQPELAKPLAARIAPAPQALVDYIRLDNLKMGLAEQTRSARIDLSFRADLQAAFDELPIAVRQRVDRKLVGIYLVEQLGGTGYVDYVYGADQRPVAGFVVLDAAVLSSRTANAWASWKENRPFRPAPGHRLSVQLETAENDNRKNAIQYILLHELGHIASIGGNIHPNPNTPPQEVASLAAYEFFNLAWLRSADRSQYVSRFDGAFTQRADLSYLTGARLGAEAMQPTYRQLSQTNFATLYSGNNPSDDFAEAFANYVHVELMHKPFEVRISAEGQPDLVYTACWQEPRCAAKKAMLLRFLEPAA